MKCLVFPLLLVATAIACGQDAGLITGTVRDKTGAVIPKAAVTISNASHGIDRTTQTNKDGEYVVPALPAGIYTVAITASGFAGRPHNREVSLYLYCQLGQHVPFQKDIPLECRS